MCYATATAIPTWSSSAPAARCTCASRRSRCSMIWKCASCLCLRGTCSPTRTRGTRTRCFPKMCRRSPSKPAHRSDGSGGRTTSWRSTGSAHRRPGPKRWRSWASRRRTSRRAPASCCATGKRSDDVTKLHDLYSQQGQSPWLDNLRRDWLLDGTTDSWISKGVRGMTSNPTIFQKAMTAGNAYDSQFGELVHGGASVDEAYWAMVCEDIRTACRLLRGIHDSSGGSDGFVSLELAPDMARETKASIDAARTFHVELAEPNLMIKIPATAEGIPAIEAMIAEGRNINITLIFGIERYREVMEAYLAGLDTF